MRAKRAAVLVGLSALALAPCIAVVLHILWYGGHLPLQDQWDTPGRHFHAHVQGLLTWKHFFLQHNEARKAFTTSVWMLLGANGWSVRIEMFASVALVVLGVVAYLGLCRRQMPGEAPRLYVLAAAASVVLFNPIGLTGGPMPWLWGVNVENAVVVVALVAALYINVTARSVTVRYAASAAASIAATYSFANGMLLWVLLYPGWYAGSAASAGPRRNIRLDALYALAFAAVVVTYFTDYRRPSHHPSFHSAVDQPGQLLEFYFAWLGAPMAPRFRDVPAAAFTGVAALSLGLWCTASVVRLGILRRALPFLALMAYAVVSGAAVSLGRSSQGATVALSSRYYLHVLVFYLGLNALLWLCSRPEVPRGRGRIPRAAFWLILVLQLGSVANNWVGIYPRHIRHPHERIARGEAALEFVYLVPDNPDLTNLHRRMRALLPRFKRLVRAGILDVDFVPMAANLQGAGAPVDQSRTLFLIANSGELHVSGSFEEIAGTEAITHLVLRTRADGVEKFISVLPLHVYPRARGGARRAIMTTVKTDNLPEGPQVIELLGYERDRRRLVPLGITAELHLGPATPNDVLDASAVELVRAPGAVTVDAVNGERVLGRAEITVAPSGPILIGGWAVDPRTEGLASRVFVRIGERLVPMQYRQPRLDVAKSRARPDLVACGFRCVLDEADANALLDAPISFVVQTRSGEYLEDPRTLTIRRAAR